MVKTILKDDFTCEEVKNFFDAPIEYRRYICSTRASNLPFKTLGEVKVVNEDEAVLKYTILEKKLCYNNGNCYIKHRILHSLTYYKKNKTIKVWMGFDGFKSPHLYSELFSYLKIDWINQITHNTLKVCMSKTLFTEVISNKITNPEMFYKRYMSVSLKISKSQKVSWNLIKKCFELKNNCSCINIHKIVNNVTNINLALKNEIDYYTHVNRNDIFTDDNKRFYHQIFIDTLNDAEILGIKINPIWGIKRLQEEHTKMTRLINKFVVSQKSEEPIYFEKEDLLKYPNKTVKLLKTEQDVFSEGLTMVHCVYTSYWKRIKNKEYFVFSAELPERCTIGVQQKYGKEDIFQLDQIYLKFDKNVSSETKNLFEYWINSKKMQEFFKINFKKLKADDKLEQNSIAS